jgi:hypothetical protein
MSMETESIVTIASSKSGLSESLPVSLATTTVKELSEWCSALLGLVGEVHLFKDGKVLDPQMKLEQAGVRSGDLLAAQEASQAPPPPAAPPAAAAAQGGGGLDFSSLLASASSAAGAGGSGSAAAPSGGLDFSNLISQQAFAPKIAEPVYYPGMTLNEAWEHNTNPEHIVSLLQSKEHLFKELNYHQPTLAGKLRGKAYQEAVQIWRDEILKGGLKTAMTRTSAFHKEQEFRRRLEKDPNDAEVSLSGVFGKL